jgi:hypothetical protein
MLICTGPPRHHYATALKLPDPADALRSRFVLRQLVRQVIELGQEDVTGLQAWFQIPNDFDQETIDRERAKMTFELLGQAKQVLDTTAADARIVKRPRGDSSGVDRGGMTGPRVQALKEPETRGGQELCPPPLRMRGAA